MQKSYKKLMLLTLLLIGLGSNVVMGTEIDSFTQRYSDIKDSLEIVDKITNELLQRGVLAANQLPLHKRTQQGLYDSVVSTVGGEYWGKVETAVENSPLVDKRHITRKESIYGDMSFRQMYPLYLVNLGSIVRMGEQIVGTDKFGHFFAQGYNAFYSAYVDAYGIAAAIKYSTDTEEGIYGLKSMGVYSYSDISANLLGMLFWKNLLEGGTYNDGFVEPYVALQDGEFVLVREFHWQEYLSILLDEGNNCNFYYDDPSYRGNIQKRIVALEKANPGKRFQCPIDIDGCHAFQSSELASKIDPDFLKYMLSPECMTTPMQFSY
ncbi:MAG: hypothetical protein HQK50_16130 [Oligoflexia bacterium]|nr:hypothetical protein [Oligoflexia bacterium]MBF0367104.1 hypothetical protein [Oligoflexia bacterium]